MSLTIAKAELIGALLGSTIYGVYIMVFIQCITVLKNRRPVNYFLLATAVSMFILITAHNLIDIMGNMQVFTSQPEGNHASLSHFSLDHWQNVVKICLYVAVTIISDTVISYRTYILWGRRCRVIIVPCLFLLASITCGALGIYSLKLASSNNIVFASSFSTHVMMFYISTLCTNIICTLLIVVKICKIQNVLALLKQTSSISCLSRISRLVPIIVESCSVYSAFLLIVIGTYASQSPTILIFMNAVPSTLGIAFSSVIVRVGIGATLGDSNATNDIPSTRLEDQAIRASIIPVSVHVCASTFLDNGAQVVMQQTVHTHVNGFPLGRAPDGQYKFISSEV